MVRLSEVSVIVLSLIALAYFGINYPRFTLALIVLYALYQYEFFNVKNVCVLIGFALLFTGNVLLVAIGLCAMASPFVAREK